MPYGATVVTRLQLEHLAERSEHDTIEVRVMASPTDAPKPPLRTPQRAQQLDG
jgi:hypothetical protein